MIIGSLKFPVEEMGEDGERKGVRFVSGFREAEGREWNGMYRRMGRTK